MSSIHYLFIYYNRTYIVGIWTILIISVSAIVGTYGRGISTGLFIYVYQTRLKG